MLKNSKHQLFKSTITNALLHLYLKVGVSSSFVTEEQRNKIIIDFLKPKLKQSRYRLIKKNLKTICLMKNKYGSVENHLNGILNEYLAKSLKNDVDKLYSVLEQFEIAGFDTKLIEETQTQEIDVVYLDRAHFDICFDDENQLIEPISLFIQTDQIEEFSACLEEQNYFEFEQLQAVQYLNKYHYKLCPMQFD
ncbi:DUF2913 family protein [Vibrio sp. MA64]|uniref:DUF2913 family protein n=1 Tax=Vibrio sp. MA64 TaxID=2896365 RepID=UPI001E594562|nr:DUF2913 family protein [Vibrio sp. MA64]MCC9651040.1 DUF2913 family protein [Vibrio sp. MA64]